MPPTKQDNADTRFRQGLTYHQAGNFAAAAACYRQALAAVPAHAPSLAMLGVLAHQAGHGDNAVDLLGRAAALQPDVASHHHNLGSVLRDLGRHEPAAAAYRAALRLQTENAEIHRNLGCALTALGQQEAACCAFRRALALAPQNAVAASDFGNLLLEMERLDEALACFDQALEMSPKNPLLWHNKGVVLMARQDRAAAIACFHEATALRPGYAAAWFSLGSAQLDQGRTEDGLACLARALSQDAAMAERLIETGSALYLSRQLAAAEAVLRLGLQHAPESADMMLLLGVTALARGDYATGWAAYHARWRKPSLAQNWFDSGSPSWDGIESLAGRTILLFAEQGHGDTIQFVRFAPLLAARGARVILVVQHALVTLLARMNGIAGCYGFGAKLPRVDRQFPLMSLPFAFGTTLATLPAECPYLQADPHAVAAWRARLNGLTGLKIGLVWAGDPRPGQKDANETDARRSLHFEQLAPLSACAGGHFISLQKGPPAAQLAASTSGLIVQDWTAELRDFADTAALVASLDLVISADTAPAHLAAALGRPVWLLNLFDSCWRWLDGRDDSPWYPRLRQFRQTAAGDWEGVVGRVRDALLELG